MIVIKIIKMTFNKNNEYDFKLIKIYKITK